MFIVQCHIYIRFIKYLAWTNKHSCFKWPIVHCNCLKSKFKESCSMIYDINELKFSLFFTSFIQVSISSTFYARLLCQYFCTKKLQSQNVTREKLRKHFCTKNLCIKCWWNWLQKFMCKIHWRDTRGQFHQHIYVQLLCL